MVILLHKNVFSFLLEFEFIRTYHISIDLYLVENLLRFFTHQLGFYAFRFQPSPWPAQYVHRDLSSIFSTHGFSKAHTNVMNSIKPPMHPKFHHHRRLAFCLRSHYPHLLTLGLAQIGSGVTYSLFFYVQYSFPSLSVNVAPPQDVGYFILVRPY